MYFLIFSANFYRCIHINSVLPYCTCNTTVSLDRWVHTVRLGSHTCGHTLQYPHMRFTLVITICAVHTRRPSKTTTVLHSDTSLCIYSPWCIKHPCLRHRGNECMVFKIFSERFSDHPNRISPRLSVLLNIAWASDLHICAGTPYKNLNELSLLWLNRWQ